MNVIKQTHRKRAKSAQPLCGHVSAATRDRRVREEKDESLKSLRYRSLAQTHAVMVVCGVVILLPVQMIGRVMVFRSMQW